MKLRTYIWKALGIVALFFAVAGFILLESNVTLLSFHLIRPEEGFSRTILKVQLNQHCTYDIGTMVNKTNTPQFDWIVGCAEKTSLEDSKPLFPSVISEALLRIRLFVHFSFAFAILSIWCFSICAYFQQRVRRKTLCMMLGFAAVLLCAGCGLMIASYERLDHFVASRTSNYMQELFHTLDSNVQCGFEHSFDWIVLALACLLGVCGTYVGIMALAVWEISRNS